MKKALIYGILGSFFFAFTFVLNRSMNLSGGHWIWSASLRYLFALPIIALIVKLRYGFKNIHSAIKAQPVYWLVWSTVGFGLFYAPLSFAGDYGESWLVAASWQITIFIGVLLTPLFGKRIPIKNLLVTGIILAGVFLMQLKDIAAMRTDAVLLTLLPIIVAAAAYPLGNRKLMAVCGDTLSTFERVYGTLLCSIPFWLILSVIGVTTVGLPSPQQSFQAFLVAVFSGIVATILFFQATNLVKTNQKQLAVIESTQSGEVIFTLLGGILLLGDSVPDVWGFVGVGLIIFGMVFNSLLCASKR